MKTIPPLLLLAAAATLALGQMAHAQNKLLDVLQDENARDADFWIYNDLAAAPRKEASRRPRRCEEAQVTEGEVAFRQEGAEDPTDLTGCSDDGDVHATQATDSPWSRPFQFPISDHPGTRRPVRRHPPDGPR